jgi:hypothetical protein
MVFDGLIAPAVDVEPMAGPAIEPIAGDIQQRAAWV